MNLSDFGSFADLSTSDGFVSPNLINGTAFVGRKAMGGAPGGFSSEVVNESTTGVIDEDISTSDDGDGTSVGLASFAGSTECFLFNVALWSSEPQQSPGEAIFHPHEQVASSHPHLSKPPLYYWTFC